MTYVSWPKDFALYVLHYFIDLDHYQMGKSETASEPHIIRIHHCPLILLITINPWNNGSVPYCE